MESILEYIMQNYTWFLGSAIIILLAIIGSYADKTNFGQGKNKESDIEKEDELNLDDLKEIQENNEETVGEPIEETTETENKENSVEVVDIETPSQENNSNLQNVSQINFEENFEKFDKEFNEILPEKEIIDDELLDEIENLSLDKTQKMDLTDIPDLDDVELPKIKSLEPDEQDIWKF